MTSSKESGLHLSGTVVSGTFGLNIDLAVAPGEIVAVLGPNGVGKTTILRTIAGLLPLGAGRLSLGGTILDDAVSARAPEDRPVSLVFHDLRLFPHLSVRDNVAFGLQVSGRPRREARAAAEAWLARFDLLPLADRRPGNVSAGQAQRVALARALAPEPAALLLDEPLAALDARTRTAVRGELAGYLRGCGIPIVLVTHDPLDAMILADRIVVVEEDGVTHDGSPTELARRPRTDYAARLVGLNLLRGRLGEDGQVDLDGGGCVMAARPDASPGQEVLVGIRPSAITLHRAAPSGASSRNLWSSAVDSLELLGDRVRVAVPGPPALLADVTTEAVAALRLAPGQPVWLSVKAMEVDVYPAQ